MICSCCGNKLEGNVHGPYSASQYYCERCWCDPSLFFPDKVQFAIEKLVEKPDNAIFDSNVMETIELFRNSARNMNKNTINAWKKFGNISIRINVIRVNQKRMPIFTGKIKASQLLILATFDHWKENRMEGYQRELFKEKAREIKTYVENCTIAIVPSLLVSFREGRFTPISGDFGTLEIPVRPGAIALLDGQQRTGGFEEIFRIVRGLRLKEDTSNFKEITNKYVELMNFELPIVLVDSNSISKKLRQTSLKAERIKPVDVERAFFFIINKTQKPVNPSLKDQLAYQTINAGITGVPVIEKQRWRTEIVPIANGLNNENSPLKGLLNLGGLTGLKKAIPLSSFISSLRPLFVTNKRFCALSFEEKKKFLTTYWGAIKDTFPQAFSEETKKEHLLTKTVGIFSLNYLASDIFNKCMEKGLDPLQKESAINFMKNLKEFDWNIKTSPLAFLGGKKGVKRAYEILLEMLDGSKHDTIGTGAGTTTKAGSEGLPSLRLLAMPENV